MNKEFKLAIELLNALNQYPHNLGEGKIYGTQENDTDFLMGCALEGLGMHDEAAKKFREATVGISEPAQAIYYNDPQPDKIFFQALAWLKLDRPEKAKSIFERLIRFGEQHMDDTIRIDYFAVSLPDMLVFDIDINQRNITHCTYLIALGHLGQGDFETAKKYLDKVLADDLNHQGAAAYLETFSFFKMVTGHKMIA